MNVRTKLKFVALPVPAWNRLPETVRRGQAQTQPHFKKLVQTFLFKEFL